MMYRYAVLAIEDGRTHRYPRTVFVGAYGDTEKEVCSNLANEITSVSMTRTVSAQTVSRFMEYGART